MASAATLAPESRPALEMEEDDEQVEEYEFSSDEESEEEDNVHDTDHYKFSDGVIPIDSDDEEEEDVASITLRHKARPWRDPGFTDAVREKWERSYLMLPNYPMGGDWQRTEIYQRQKDLEMAKYLKDYPPERWTLPRPEANAAVANLEERRKWRQLGMRIFGAQADHQLYQGAPMYHPGFAPHPQHPMHPQMYPQMPYGPLPPQHQHILPTQANFAVRPPGQIGYPHQQPNMYHPQMNMQPQMLGPQYANGGSKSRGNSNQRQRQTSTVPPTQSNIRIPPYKARDRPSDQKPTSKPGKRQGRRPAQAQEFPWNRQLDFQAERIKATWDVSQYDQSIRYEIDRVHERNKLKVDNHDKKDKDPPGTPDAGGMEQSRQQSNTPGSGSDPDRPPSRTGPKPGNKGANFTRQDCYGFKGLDDRQRAMALLQTANPIPEDVMDAYEKGQVSLEQTADIMICWNPNKTGFSQELEKAYFRIKDHLATVDQLERTPILTDTAVEFIIDFCPDMLWRELLLRIVTETSYGNMGIRNRICWNGDHFDKATITKRIGSALGIKQQQAATRQPRRPAARSSSPAQEKVKGYAEGEDDWYNNNVLDYNAYMAFFKLRVTARGTIDLKRPAASGRGAGEDEEMGEGEGGPKKKRARTGESMTSPETISSNQNTPGAEAGEEDEGEGEEEENDKDAVSMQSDTLLDEIED
ncbi:uncharacterized protein LTR77_000097 [Saxophila tyrrhenica]|uniref:Uncharacterized protein n=1 Tax=Saxophila tyrrhenica TaxID=1690608 RepID=A0AAV9PMD3_9PEZI|nr:hypothetical protein LTR77_000097 [Saxophila tyrrhenica]